MIWVDSVEKLEKTLENSIKESYSEWDYIRCYNLMKLMAKVNPDNHILLKYVTKLDEKKVGKIRDKWAKGGSWFVNIFKSPKLYLTFVFLLLLGKIK